MENNYLEFRSVSKAIIKMIFKKPNSSEEVKSAIRPVKDYHESIEDISKLKEELEDLEIDLYHVKTESEASRKIFGFAFLIKRVFDDRN